MRQESKTISGVGYTLHYPSEVCLAYNYNSILIESTDAGTIKYNLNISNSNRSYWFYADSFDGKADIYISKILQMLFEDVPNKRNETIQVYIRRGDTLISNFSMVVLYANLTIGERMGTIGAFNHEVKEHYERHLTWFCYYPFRSSTFALADATIATRNDDNAYVDTGMAVENTGIVDFTLTPSQADVVKDKYIFKYVADIPASVFDSTYDNSFFQLGSKDTRIVCEKSEKKKGYFFRWIDRRGYWMQYLFDKGTDEVKAQPSGNVRTEIAKLNGMQFEGQRELSINVERKIKCGASNLDQEHYTDVASIATACYVDLFMGYDSTGGAIWLPVNVSGASHVKNEQMELNDFEIEVEIVEYSQQL